ncbi:MAG TPA: hypothetical protein VF056_02420 [Thermoleophilaceae bacterium]
MERLPAALTCARAPLASIVTSVSAPPVLAAVACVLDRDGRIVAGDLTRCEKALREAELELLGLELGGLHTRGRRLGVRQRPEHEHRHIVRGLVRRGDHELEQRVGVLVGSQLGHHCGQPLAAEHLVGHASLQEAVGEQAHDRARGKREAGLAHPGAGTHAERRRRRHGERLVDGVLHHVAGEGITYRSVL